MPVGSQKNQVQIYGSCTFSIPIRVHLVLNKSRSTSNGVLDYFEVDTSMGVS